MAAFARVDYRVESNQHLDRDATCADCGHLEWQHEHDPDYEPKCCVIVARHGGELLERMNVYCACGGYALPITAPIVAPNEENEMRQGFKAENNVDDDGNPAGGTVRGTGITIDWQNGPLGRGKDRKEPNGAFVEDVIDAVIQRIEHYESAQDGKFACFENQQALSDLRHALGVLELRTKQREARGVEGTHES